MIEHTVAPHAGAWIEINAKIATRESSKSRPMRARGLKYGFRRLPA